MKAKRPGVEFATLESGVERPNHYTSRPATRISDPSSYVQTSEHQHIAQAHEDLSGNSSTDHDLWRTAVLQFNSLKVVELETAVTSEYLLVAVVVGGR